MDLLDGKIFTMLVPFFRNNSNLKGLYIEDCNLGDDGWRLLALAIGSSSSKSLQKVSLTGCNISDEGSVDIITSLSMHPHLHNLWWNGNRLSTKGCKALETLLSCSCTELQHLALGSNELDDECIGVLVPALKNCSHLQTLVLSTNSAISLRGWKRLGSLLEAPYLNFTNLYIAGNNNIDDEVVTALRREH